MLSGSIDFILDRGHPQCDVNPVSLAADGGSWSSIDTNGWTAAIAVGQAEWIVLLDRRAVVPVSDLQSLAELFATENAPVLLQPLASADAAKRFIGENCPPSVSHCWSNPTTYSTVCVRRSALTTLPALNDDHAEPIWDWLIRAGQECGVVSHVAAKHAEPLFALQKDCPTLTSPSQPPENSWLIDHIQRSKPSQFVAEKNSEADAVAVKAGLLLWHEAADASHQLSQSIEGLGRHQAGDYWHAITHRREPDYSNAKYWFRHVGVHPVFADLIPHAARILDGLAEEPVWKTRLWGRGSWDPFAFVDLCESCAGHENTPLGVAARQIQAIEMQLLMVSTYRDASGKKV